MKQCAEKVCNAQLEKLQSYSQLMPHKQPYFEVCSFLREVRLNMPGNGMFNRK